MANGRPRVATPSFTDLVPSLKVFSRGGGPRRLNRTERPSVAMVMTNSTAGTSNPSHPSPRRISRRRAGLAAGVVALALLGAACSSSKPKVSTGGNPATTTSTVQTTATTVAKAGASGGVGF